MNTLTFYVVRFAAPTLGFLLLIALGQPAGWRWLDLVSIAIALVILTGILLVPRSELLARTVGTRAGRLVGRFRQGVDPEAWAQG